MVVGWMDKCNQYITCNIHNIFFGQFVPVTREQSLILTLGWAAVMIFKKRDTGKQFDVDMLVLNNHIFEVFVKQHPGK
jgi:hypothetical protein